MKIASYNVNGIRAAIKKGFLDWLVAANPDVICLQETKAHKEQLDLSLFEEAGYPYHYWFSAQKKGYSSVAILCKEKPEEVVYGTGIDYMDNEGRNLLVRYPSLSIMSLYLPSGTNTDRLDYKFKYMDDFLQYTKELRKTDPNLVICGDYNICHQAIDIHDPVRNKTVSGFLPEERAWLSELLESGFIDSFRHLNKSPDQYSWWSYRAGARGNNKGWRLDYALVSTPIEKRIKKAQILQAAVHSDHCPITVEID
ncbi:MAG: exodeoxyribonuclease III [Flavobacteriaceae bacterium]|jgi:exodeoxyribonuclease-3|nr:exodeoxyribonuclease III [Flavobacteriaceae bacterium]MCI5088011.1 exodeoxyribonuclease III [Flavobacteriaceae bacterium]